MAQIFKTTAILSSMTGAPIPVFTTEEMEEMVLQYWGTLDAEQTFPIPFWKLEALFAQAASQEVALRVTDITNLAEVDATWSIFDESAEKETEDVYYFVLNKLYFTGPIELDGKKLGGILKSVDNPQNALVLGRLGKDKEGKYYAFLKAATFSMVAPALSIAARGEDEEDTDGTTTGVKIP